MTKTLASKQIGGRLICDSKVECHNILVEEHEQESASVSHKALGKKRTRQFKLSELQTRPEELEKRYFTTSIGTQDKHKSELVSAQQKRRINFMHRAERINSKEEVQPSPRLHNPDNKPVPC